MRLAEQIADTRAVRLPGEEEVVFEGLHGDIITFAREKAGAGGLAEDGFSVTFDGRDESWGEFFTAEDARRVAALLAPADPGIPEALLRLSGAVGSCALLLGVLVILVAIHWLA